MSKLYYLCALLLASQPILQAYATDFTDPQLQGESNSTFPEVEPTPAFKQQTTQKPLPSEPKELSKPQAVSQPSVRNITPFTGKVTRNKVRIRLQPSLESGILKELQNGDLVIVTGETEDFYAVEPPANVKGYIYRTYVLDGVVEGNRVNVRLEPDLNAPVITQLNSGDVINNGVIYQDDKKWIEFTPPPSARFFIAKEYVTKIGDRSMMANIKRRKEEVTNLFNSASQEILAEMRKTFDQVNLEEPFKKLNKIVKEYSDFPEEASKAQVLLTSTQETYLKKKVIDMENKLKTMSTNTQNSPAAEILKPQTQATGMNSKMAAWQLTEQALFEEWAKQAGGNPSIDDFYAEQKQNAVTLQGVIEPYNRAVRNKPGDFVLVTQNTHLPIAYLYSTKVNLQDKEGQTVVVQVAPRDNHNFAFPAYFVLSVE